ncbi:RHS repeat-associated core domain-containing protein [Dactylosporangium salmoneum]|uniref:Teneurin-like YD-shell domain-containing protein n=1 Tax=Dactylosporangium salmoneum TaxID=53361 RepID=A0ABN3GHJ8_9ACTN
MLHRRGWFGVRLVRQGRGRVGLAVGLVLAVSAGVLTAPPYAAAVPVPGALQPDRPTEASVPVTSVAGKTVPLAESDRVGQASAGAPVWPAGGTASIAVDTASLGAAGSAVSAKTAGGGAGRAGGLAVRVRKQGLDPADAQSDPKAETRLLTASGPSVVRLSVADRTVADKAQVQGVLFTLVRDDGEAGAGKVALDVDYSSFAGAYGGNYGGRLRLVRLPECVLTTPERAECQVQTPVDGAVNSAASQVVSFDAVSVADGAGMVFAAGGGADAVVAAGGAAGSTPLSSTGQSASTSTAGSTPLAAAPSGQTVYALSASPSSSGGDYTHTSLNETSSWAAGSQGGEFGYSVPLTMPPGLGGPVPDVTLQYSSASVDGRTVAKNAQSSWAGEGWDYNPGYIEQTYRPCKDDGWTNNDLCYLSEPPMTMSFGGHSGRLVWDAVAEDPNDRYWHLESDDGSRIELVVDDASKANGDYRNRYWKLTTQDGTQYFFGMNKRYADDPQSTNSTQNVLVYGNHSWEPCHSNVHDWWSGCDMTYRWNLDYVVDPRGNTMTYFYEKYRGKYGNWNGTDTHVYDLTDTLTRIEYGTRAGTEGASNAPMQVVFDTGVRCSTEPCADHPENWPDTPWDQFCATTVTACAAHQSPTYWTPFRLTTVTTKVSLPSQGGYQDADVWSLQHIFPDSGEAGVSPSLWFNYLYHNGVDYLYQNGVYTRTVLPANPMHFGGDRLQNLVAAAGPYYQHYRMTVVDTGTGHITTAAYSPPECTFSNINGVPWDQFPLRCFPQWNGVGWNYFHKYVVTKVTDIDALTGSPNVETSYVYSTEGSSTNTLWHFGGDEAATATHRSFTDFAGYSTVTTTVGAAGGLQSVSKKLYYRGLNGDFTSAGVGTRQVTITSLGTEMGPNGTPSTRVVIDAEGLRGTLVEEQALDGSGLNATVLSRTIHLPWQFTTASRATNSNIGTISARYNREAQTDTGTWLPASSTWRWSRTTHTYDTKYALETAVKDDGDPNVTTDDVCTTNTYATPDKTKWMIDYPVQAVSTTCAAAPAAADYLAGTQTFYDSATTVGATPTKGLTTMTKKLSAVNGSTLTWVQASRAGYDSYGRLTDGYDQLDKHSTTVYSPASGSAVTSTTVTNPLGHVTVTTLNPLRAMAVKVVDPNSKTTTVEYDALGRLTKVVRQHSAANGPTTNLPDIEYTYTLRSTGGPNTVVTKTLGPNGNQIVSYQLYDGLMRLRQTQAPGPQANGGRIITDTAYDSRNLVTKTSTFWNSAAPTDSVAGFADADVVTQHRFTYDNVGRKTVDALWSANVLKWQTTTVYQGDRVATTPPAGGITTQTVFDVRGKTTELRQYATSNLNGSFTKTTYTYDRLGRLTAATDPAGNSWTSHYDLRGRLDSSSDPDKGSATAVYDNADRLTTATDARGISLTYTYDDLGRRTAAYDGTNTTGFKRTQWIYDTVAKGQPTSSTRYIGQDAFTTTVTGYDDAYRPLGTTTVIPSSLSITGLPSGSYTTNTTYNLNGSVATVSYPAAGDLPAETVTSTYDNTGLPLTLTSPANTYVAGTSYYNLGGLYQQIIGANGKRVRQTTTVDQATGRLVTAATDTENQTTPNTWVEQLTENYGYDPAGNVTGINETSAGATVSNQCFSYDNLRQLTEAWTTTATTCQTTPTLTAVGGPDPYWTSYSYNNPTGNRTREVRHALTGTDTTRDYTYPATGQRHTLSTVTTSGATTGTDTFQYDTAGNTTTRNISGKPGQTLTWDNEGHLAIVADTSGTTSYVYDADGNRLVVKDTAGVTVYLAGFELRKTGAITTCTRYVGEATRTATATTWVASDAHSTGQLAIDAATLSTTRRKADPFGNPRGADPSWPNPHGFVGGIRDNTGLTHLGAREYDPNTGRFISDDPITDPSDPQQLNGYVYAAANPVTNSDPNGLRTCSGPADCGSDESHGNSAWGSGSSRKSSAINKKICGARGGGSCYRGKPLKVKPTPKEWEQRCWGGPLCRNVENGVPDPGSRPWATGPLVMPGVTDPGSRPWATGPLVMPGVPDTGSRPTPGTPTGPGGLTVVKMQGCDVIPGLGAYSCPNAYPGLHMVGVCFTGGAGALFGGSFALCVGADGQGLGMWSSYGTNQGPQFGTGASVVGVLSSGNIDDQRGRADTIEGGIGPISVSESEATSGGVTVYTESAGVGLKGNFAGVASGDSNTWWVWRFYNW